MLLTVKKAADSTATAKSPTPRGWTRVQELLNNCSLPKKLMQELVSGILGPETAASFFGYLKNREYAIPSAAAMLADYETVREGMARLVAYGRLDILCLVLKKAVNLLNGSAAQGKNLDKMLAALPEEFQLMFFKALAEGRPELFMEIAQQTDAMNTLSDRIFSLIS
jgi:hypothetical protein